ncbi:MAG: hypothetical protein ACI8TQ_001795 [Planctomycetota bacterium]|jgi:hypothetical protein
MSRNFHHGLLALVFVSLVMAAEPALAGEQITAGVVDVSETDATEATAMEAINRTVEANLAVGKESPLRVDRGEEELALFIPVKEELIYEVNVAWGVIGTALGSVTMTSGVEDYRRSLLVPTKADNDRPQKTGWIKAHAYGEHLFYTLDATLEARHQPTDWPQIVYRSKQGGSEVRRRELLVGVKEGKSQSSYRRDTGAGAPRGTRIWRDPVVRDVPATALDMTSAVYLVRTFIASGLETTNFAVIDKDELWDMRLSLGASMRQKTPAGIFDTVEVILVAIPYEGEEKREKKKFEGLFGLHGSIHLWVDRAAGVPIRIMGEVPAGPLTLDVDITLMSFKGTPSAMRAVAPVAR